MFKALTWIWLSKVNGPALPKKGRCIKVDKAPPEKFGSEKKLLTIEAHPPFTRYSIIFEKKSNRVPGHQSVYYIIRYYKTCF